MKEIKNIAILRPILVYDVIKQKHYASKKGCMIVEYVDNTRRELDLQNMVDLTDNIDYEYEIYKKTRIKWIFKGRD